MATATLTSKVGTVLKDALPNSINLNKLLDTVLALTTKGSPAQVDNLFTIILTALRAPLSRASVALPKATTLGSGLDPVSPQRPTSHPKAKPGPPTSAKPCPPTPPPSTYQPCQPVLAWVSRDPLLTAEPAAPPIPTEEAPAPVHQAPNDSPPRAPMPTDIHTPIQASRLLDIINNVQADLHPALPLTQGSPALQLEATSPLSSPCHEATLPPRMATPPSAPIQTPTGPNPIPVHAPPTRSLPPRAPLPGPSTLSPPQCSIDHTFVPTALLPKTKPADPWAKFEVLPNPATLDIFAQQYADTIKGKQPCNRFLSTIKRLMEPDTPFHGPYSSQSLHKDPHPTEFTQVIVKSFLVREVVARRTPSPALIDFLSTHFPKVCCTKQTTTLSNSYDLHEVYNSIFKEGYVIT
jgi:hypothetical protein